MNPGRWQTLRGGGAHPLSQCWLGQHPRGLSPRGKDWYFCLANPLSAVAVNTESLKLFNSWILFVRQNPSDRLPYLLVLMARRACLRSLTSSNPTAHNKRPRLLCSLSLSFSSCWLGIINVFLIIWSVLQCEFLLGFIALGITRYFISYQTGPALIFNNGSVSEDRKPECFAKLKGSTKY